MNEQGTVYTDGLYWIRVEADGNQFRAFSNGRAITDISLVALEYRDSEIEAQADLDKLASEQGWAKV